ncbi:MAG: hypothetical protein HQL52_00750 [Magnetococcales bacterium]|nr:hypothetical protein [Magnetococcales bacterium]
MALSTKYYVAALNARRELHTPGVKALSRLTSGRAPLHVPSEDAAGMAFVNSMARKIRDMNGPIREVNDGISMAQVAENALKETSQALQRIRDLMVEKDSASPDNSEAIQNDIARMVAQIEQIADGAQFNGQPLLQGNVNDLTLPVGGFEDPNLTLTIPRADLTALGLDADPANEAWEEGADDPSPANPQNLAAVDGALDYVQGMRSDLQEVLSRIGEVMEKSTQAPAPRDPMALPVMDNDRAAGSADQTREAILDRPHSALQAQANQDNDVSQKLLS